MRTLSSEFAAHLGSGVTTLCRCWRVTRRDGAALGFTDHDGDLAFDGTAFAASSGLDAAEASTQLGLAVGGGEVAGALSAASLTPRDLARGLWDAAQVEVFLVNWQDTAQRIRQWVGEIGEVKRDGVAFSAELRGLMHRLEAQTGRLFARGCDACLGDARCGVDVGSSLYSGTGTVAAVTTDLELRVTGLDDFAPDWFTHGALTWSAGENANMAVTVREHSKSGSVTILRLWEPLPDAATPGDAFTITAGCDRQFVTCKAKFANAANFRGFPHIPGTEAVLAYPSSRDANDGGSYFA